jgi:ketosteroid isomerase-like protein
MNDGKPVARVIADMEEALYAGLTSSDAAALADVMSDELVYVHSSGIAETKAENLAGQRSGLYVRGPIARRGTRIRIFGDVAVTSAVIDMVDLAHGPRNTLHLQETLVWRKETSGWRLLLRQATRLPADPC